MTLTARLHRQAWLLLLAVGCGSPATPATVAVHGKVCYRGKPLPTGVIVFVPDVVRGNPGPLVRADIHADGTYQLAGATGVGPGWHRVTIVAIEETPPVRGQHWASLRSLLPEKYRDPDLSGLSCEVQAGKDNTINFNLE